MQGYINSYVDFFYLTHRHDAATAAEQPTAASSSSSSASSSSPPAAPAADSSPSSYPITDTDPPPLVRPATVLLPPGSLPFLSHHLSTAEASHRAAVPAPIFASFSQLIGFFSSLHDYKTAVYFADRSLELAETIPGQRESQLSALAVLGGLYEAMDQPRAAIGYYERCGELAKATGAGEAAAAGDEGVVRRARQQLVRAYERHAMEHEAAGDWQQAVPLFHRAIASARELQDLQSEMDALYHLALIAAKQAAQRQTTAAPAPPAALASSSPSSDSASSSPPSSSPAGAHSAIEYLQSALSIARHISSPLQSSVLYQLALCYQSARELGLAVQYLKDALSLCPAGDALHHSQLLTALGSLYAEQGEYRDSLRQFESCYELSRGISSRQQDTARINVGKSRGNVLMTQFMRLVEAEGEEPMRQLIHWKTRRQGIQISNA